MARRGDRGAARRLPRRAARQGRDRRRDRRVPRRDARPRRCRSPVDPMALDIVGTGGDRFGTVNISTMAAIVAAGRRASRWSSTATGPRARRPARRTCSRRSASTSTLPPERVAAVLDEVGHHVRVRPRRSTPDSRHAGPTPRRELGVPTVFNFLGPLCNPARPEASAVGVRDARPHAADRRRLPDPRRDRAGLPRRRRPRRAVDHRPQPHLGGLAGPRHRARHRPARPGHPPGDGSRICSGRTPRTTPASRVPCSRAKRARCATSSCSTRRPGSSRTSSRPTRRGSRRPSWIVSVRKWRSRPQAIDSGAAAAKLDEWVTATH